MLDASTHDDHKSVLQATHLVSHSALALQDTVGENHRGQKQGPGSVEGDGRFGKIARLSRTVLYNLNGSNRPGILIGSGIHSR